MEDPFCIARPFEATSRGTGPNQHNTSHPLAPVVAQEKTSTLGLLRPLGLPF